MNRSALLFAAAVLAVSAAVSRADEAAAPDASPAAPPAAAPAAPPSAAPAPAAPEAKPEAEARPEAKSDDSAPPAAPEPESEEKPAPPPVAAAPAVPAPEAKPVEKPLDSCAAKFAPVADSYQKAHDNMLAWLRAASGKMDDVNGKIADLKKVISEKEARITQLKLDAAPGGDAEAKTLDQQSRDLWAQLKTQESARKDLCRALSSAAEREVRALNGAVLDDFNKAAQAQ